jgi:hypothetical protein
VNLVAVGDGGPGPLSPRVTRRPKRKPLLPSQDEIAKLPRLARVAFAARCVQRSAPAMRRADRLADLLSTAEQKEALAGLLAADDPRVAAETVARAAGVILRVACDPRDLLFIRSDFEWLREQVEANGWTDDTPVPPEVFGPMWPPGRVPKWAREKEEPRG